MTVQEAHIQVKLGLDKADSFNSANFLDAEIDQYLSDAQEEFIEQRAYGNNLKKESVEETQKRVKDLQSIISNANIGTFIQNSDNRPFGRFIPLPSDYRHALQENIELTYTDCNNIVQLINVPVKALTHNEYNTITQNPFAKPSLNQVYRLSYGRFNNQEHFEVIIPPSTTLITYRLRYLKNPTKIDKAQRLIPPGLAGSATMDLADESYREIIRIAISNALNDIESPRGNESKQRLNEVE